MCCFVLVRIYWFTYLADILIRLHPQPRKHVYYREIYTQACHHASHTAHVIIVSTGLVFWAWLTIAQIPQQRHLFL